MSQISKLGVVTAMVLLAFATVTSMHAQDSAAALAAPDSKLYTTYSGSRTNVGWVVCGSTLQTSGCYSSGSIGPFVGVGAMLEGNPSISGHVVTRAIYVVDSGGANVTLYVYKKVDNISPSYDSVTVTLSRTVSLPLTGGSTAVCFMAANNRFLVIGTDLSYNGVEVNKGTFSITNVGGFSPPIPVTSITADQYGYVTVTQAGAFTLVGPDGSFQEDGGGTDFVLGTTQAVSAGTLLGASAPTERRLGIRPNVRQ
jgi:hypothetical protein